MSLHGIWRTSTTDGVFVYITRLLDDRAHFRHGFDGDDALDCKVRLITDSQPIRRRPESSTLSVIGSRQLTEQLTDRE